MFSLPRANSMKMELPTAYGGFYEVRSLIRGRAFCPTDKRQWEISSENSREMVRTDDSLTELEIPVFSDHSLETILFRRTLNEDKEPLFWN